MNAILVSLVIFVTICAALTIGVLSGYAAVNLVISLMGQHRQTGPSTVALATAEVHSSGD